MFGNSVASLLAWAGLHHPVLQAIAIILGTFILEDAATVLAAMQADEGKLSTVLALAALYVGIMLGDLGLYGLGRLSAKLPLVARYLPPQRTEAVRAWLHGRVFKVVLISRFLPGMRLPTYTTCGFVGANLRQFALAVVLATICWTSLLFGVSLRIGQVLIDHFGAWRWAGAAGFAVFVIVAGRLTASGLQSKRRSHEAGQCARHNRADACGYAKAAAVLLRVLAGLAVLFSGRGALVRARRSLSRLHPADGGQPDDHRGRTVRRVEGRDHRSGDGHRRATCWRVTRASLLARPMPMRAERAMVAAGIAYPAGGKARYRLQRHRRAVDQGNR